MTCPAATPGPAVAEPPPAFYAGCAALGLDGTGTLAPAFARYLTLLLEANRRVNLTAVPDPVEVWSRHILDSLSLLPHLGRAGRVLDLGSGGGLPGIPLALAEPGREVHLLEATGKKVQFLETAVQALELPHVRVLRTRAEEAGRRPDCREQYDVVVSRAVAALPVLLELGLPLIRVGGRMLALKGPHAEAEALESEFAAHELGADAPVPHPPSACGAEGSRVVETAKVRPCPNRYPRRSGIPAKRPLGEKP